MNTADMVLIAVIAAAVALAVRACVKRRKKGGCCGECSRCRSGCKVKGL